MDKEQGFNYGVLCISLDTEFFWGVHDTSTIEKYGNNIYNGKHIVIKELLSVFEQYGIHATWAVVGAIMADDKKQLEKYLPPSEYRPRYSNSVRSPYHLLDTLGISSDYDDLFFGQDIIKMIQGTEHQEIGTHTFSHYYCREEGQTVEEFSADIDSSIAIAEALDISLNSIVFPKNEMSEAHIAVCNAKGLKVFRGCERNWIYSLRLYPLRKILRFLDSYFNISGTNLHMPTINNGLLDITGSRFLRPYMKKLSFMENLKVRRIKKQMLAAAKKKQVFHLWFHPHNFGGNFEKNMSNLREILDYYLELNKKYNFTSMNMNEIATEFIDL